MQTTKTKLPFKGTAEQEQQLKAVIEAHKGQLGSMMPVLQQAQDIYGYLPIEVQIMIADGLGCSLEEVYGVATFYSQFSLNPKGKNNVQVCMGTACYVKGAGDVLERIETKLGIKDGETTDDGQFSLGACRCIGACGLAPVIMINDDVYGRLTPDECDAILAKYKE